MLQYPRELLTHLALQRLDYNPCSERLRHTHSEQLGDG